MTQPRRSVPDGYTPGRRTALVLTGAGTAGAYHAGVLRALHESGVRIDVAAGCGIGVVGAIFAAIDAGQQLWDPDGLWRRPEARRSYTWRPGVHAALWSLAFALASLVIPVLTLLAGLLAYPVAYLAEVVGVPGGQELVRGYGWLMAAALAPGALPTILPRLAVIGLAALAVSLGVVGLARRNRRRRGRFAGCWWSVLAAPLSARVLAGGIRSRLWRVIAGAPGRREPPLDDFGRLYTDLLADSLGQPGFRELVLVVHDVDARRDLVFAMLAGPWRRGFFRAQTSTDGIRRSAEAFDLAGVARSHLMDTMLASLAVPGITEPRLVTFAPDSPWRGEAHRLGARTGSIGRLLAELERAGVEQVILVSASPDVVAPHSLRPERADIRGRLGEYLAAAEAAAVHDALTAGRSRIVEVFPILPAYNALGPFDFTGCRDERSDRRYTLAEALERGYEDAYRQFIEPIVADERGAGIADGEPERGTEEPGQA